MVAGHERVGRAIEALYPDRLEEYYEVLAYHYVRSANADKAKRLVARLAKDFPREHEPCPIGSDRALDTALITAPEARDPLLLAKLDAVAGRVLGKLS